MLKKRYLTDLIFEELAEKMIFLGGPRQVGKTTLAREFVAKKFRETGYYNWDSRADRRRLMKSDWPGNAELIILDEIHKYKKWKSFVKGEYDYGKLVLIFKRLMRNGYFSSFLNNPRPYEGSLIVVASFARHLESPYF